MEEGATTTLENIEQAALAEFLDKGFQGASLRPAPFTVTFPARRHCSLRSWSRTLPP